MSKDITEISEKAKPKRQTAKTFLVKGLTIKGKKNITLQQSEYMKLTGKKLRKEFIAAMMLETGTI